MKVPDVVGAVASAVLRMKRRYSKHQSLFSMDVEDMRALKQLVENTACPVCPGKLGLDRFDRGPLGFEIHILCGNCAFESTIDSLGFRANQLNNIERRTKTK